MDPDDVARLVEELKLTHEASESTVHVAVRGVENKSRDLRRFLVGKIFAMRVVNRETLKVQVPRILQLRRPVDIEIVGDNLFVVVFGSDEDRCHVIMDGLWHFFNSLMVFKAPVGFQNPMDVGKFKEVDVGERGSCVGQFARVRVCQPIDKPLQRCVKVSDVLSGESRIILLLYKRLPDFYHACGHVGHVFRHCNDTAVDKEKGALSGRTKGNGSSSSGMFCRPKENGPCGLNDEGHVMVEDYSKDLGRRGLELEEEEEEIEQFESFEEKGLDEGNNLIGLGLLREEDEVCSEGGVLGGDLEGEGAEIDRVDLGIMEVDEGLREERGVGSKDKDVLVVADPSENLADRVLANASPLMQEIKVKVPPSLMNALVWNVRGLGSKRAFHEFRRLLENRAPIGNKGGLLLLWKWPIDVTIRSYSPGHIDCMGRFHDVEWRWRLEGKSLAIGGDFNEIMFDSEKIGGKT
ncbi:hypothetical protein C2S52_001719 [Perilla frutescens var. hirtella]|nr:hypothetical protein C2S52_001719 [Perilla frutescens var. hirtella]